MCTASHNPKAYTGAKLVEKGAVALSGDTGIGEIRDLFRPASARARRRVATRSSTSTPDFQQAAAASSTPRPSSR